MRGNLININKPPDVLFGLKFSVWILDLGISPSTVVR